MSLSRRGNRSPAACTSHAEGSLVLFDRGRFVQERLSSYPRLREEA